MIEIWKQIPGYEDLYDVSDCGHVRSYRAQEGLRWYVANTPQRILQPGQQTSGYAIVVLRDNNHKPRSKLVHQLVLLTFVGPRPDGLESCHNDGNPFNNCLTNLRYDTSSANQLEVKRPAIVYSIPDSTIIAIRQDRAAGISVSAISKKYAITKPRIYNLCTGKTYKDVAGPHTKGRVHGFNMIPYKEPVLTEQTPLEKDITDMIAELNKLMTGPAWPGRQYRTKAIIRDLMTMWYKYQRTKQESNTKIEEAT